MTKCECNGPGFCKRHGINKPPHLYRLCKTSQKYFRAWEAGKGPTQVTSTIKAKPSYNSHIGDLLASRFESIGIIPIPGCPCKDVQRRLNEITPEAVLSDIVGWSKKLQRSARKWKELKGGAWKYVPTPPLFLCQKVLEEAVKLSKESTT